MENQFFVDSGHLSPEALEKKHRLETDPSCRKNHMEYLPGMEIIESDVCRQVMEQRNSFDYSVYTVRDVRAALDHDTCSVEDFKALLSPAAEPFFGGNGAEGADGDKQAFREYGISLYSFVHCELLRKLLRILRIQLL